LEAGWFGKAGKPALKQHPMKNAALNRCLLIPLLAIAVTFVSHRYCTRSGEH
jgi:hypothetical protein